MVRHFSRNPDSGLPPSQEGQTLPVDKLMAAGAAPIVRREEARPSLPETAPVDQAAKTRERNSVLRIILALSHLGYKPAEGLLFVPEATRKEIDEYRALGDAELGRVRPDPTGLTKVQFAGDFQGTDYPEQAEILVNKIIEDVLDWVAESGIELPEDNQAYAYILYNLFPDAAGSPLPLPEFTLPTFRDQQPLGDKRFWTRGYTGTSLLLADQIDPSIRLIEGVVRAWPGTPTRVERLRDLIITAQISGIVPLNILNAGPQVEALGHIISNIEWDVSTQEPSDIKTYFERNKDDIQKQIEKFTTQPELSEGQKLEEYLKENGAETTLRTLLEERGIELKPEDDEIIKKLAADALAMGDVVAYRGGDAEAQNVKVLSALKTAAIVQFPDLQVARQQAEDQEAIFQEEVASIKAQGQDAKLVKNIIRQRVPGDGILSLNVAQQNFFMSWVGEYYRNYNSESGELPATIEQMLSDEEFVNNIILLSGQEDLDDKLAIAKADRTEAAKLVDDALQGTLIPDEARVDLINEVMAANTPIELGDILTNVRHIARQATTAAEELDWFTKITTDVSAAKELIEAAAIDAGVELDEGTINELIRIIRTYDYGQANPLEVRGLIEAFLSSKNLQDLDLKESLSDIAVKTSDKFKKDTTRLGAQALIKARETVTLRGGQLSDEDMRWLTGHIMLARNYEEIETLLLKVGEIYYASALRTEKQQKDAEQAAQASALSEWSPADWVRKTLIDQGILTPQTGEAFKQRLEVKVIGPISNALAIAQVQEPGLNVPAFISDRLSGMRRANIDEQAFQSQIGEFPPTSAAQRGVGYQARQTVQLPKAFSPLFRQAAGESVAFMNYLQSQAPTLAQSFQESQQPRIDHDVFREAWQSMRKVSPDRMLYWPNEAYMSQARGFARVKPPSPQSFFKERLPGLRTEFETSPSGLVEEQRISAEAEVAQATEEREAKQQRDRMLRSRGRSVFVR